MNRKCLIINLIGILLVAFTVTGFAADNKSSVAVLDFESMGTEDYLGKAVSEIMRTALVSNENYRVVERAQINNALSEQKFQKSGIIDDKSAVEIGKLLGADLIIVGSVVKIGNAYTINSRMIDVKTGEAKLGRNVTGTDLNLLTSMSNELVENLFGTASQQVKQKTITDKKVTTLDSWEGFDFTGKWEMVANISYQFLLEISQQGDRVTGTITRTNGSEPVDRITGLVSTDGTIQFIRHREGAWRQDYTGRISRETGNPLITGTFSHDRSGSYPWQAKHASAVIGGNRVASSPGRDIFKDRLSSGEVVWKTMEGQGKDLAVSKSGSTAWAIGSDNGIYFHSGGGWQQYPGEGRGMAIAVSSEGTPFVIGMDYGIYKGTGKGWIQLPGGGKGKDIAIDGRGNAWVIGMDDGIYYHDGSHWTQYPGRGRGLAITVTANGVPFVIGMDNGIYKGTGSGWVQLPGGGKGKDIAIDGKGNAWVIGMDDGIYYHDSVSWRQLPGGGRGHRIAVNNSGIPFVIGLDYAIWRF